MGICPTCNRKIDSLDCLGASTAQCGINADKTLNYVITREVLEYSCPLCKTKVADGERKAIKILSEDL